MNKKAKAKARAQALAWLEEWKQQNPEKLVVQNKGSAYLRMKTPARNNRRATVGKAINSVWQSVTNPSPQKTKLWGWHKG